MAEGAVSPPSSPGPAGGPRPATSSLGEAALAAGMPVPALGMINDLEQECFVFQKKSYSDVIWQIGPPRRLLKYNPTILHAYGWIPLIPLRNWRATVFHDPFLLSQFVTCCGWIYFIHLTGLGTTYRGARVFVDFFATNYQGSVIVLCMIITFVLGLFVNLVVTRWRAAPSSRLVFLPVAPWEVRVQYGVILTLCRELAWVISTNMAVPFDVKSRKAQKSWTPEERALYDQNRQAMELMIRYINLGHLLLLTEAQKSELGDFAETLEKRFGRWARERVKTVPVLRYVLLLDREGAMVDILGNPKKTFTNLMGAMTDVFQLGNAVTGSDLAHIGIQTEEEREREEKLRVEGDLGFDRFRRMGLVTADEWEKLKLGEKDGNPKWRSCFQWLAYLMAKAVDEKRLTDRVGAPASMQAMCMEIRNAGGRIFTMLGTQLPYPYVHLVSFTCHMYLFVLATYCGFIHRTGIPGAEWPVNLAGTDGRTFIGTVYTKHTTGGAEESGPLLRSLLYVYIIFVVCIIKGLLGMHTLLENPFGTHVCKFPLRHYSSELMRNNRAIMRDKHEREPETIRKLFTRFNERKPGAPTAAMQGAPAPQAAAAAAPAPPPALAAVSAPASTPVPAPAPAPPATPVPTAVHPPAPAPPPVPAAEPEPAVLAAAPAPVIAIAAAAVAVASAAVAPEDVVISPAEESGGRSSLLGLSGPSGQASTEEETLAPSSSGPSEPAAAAGAEMVGVPDAPAAAASSPRPLTTVDIESPSQTAAAGIDASAAPDELRSTWHALSADAAGNEAGAGATAQIAGQAVAEERTAELSSSVSEPLSVAADRGGALSRREGLAAVMAAAAASPQDDDLC